MREWVENMKTTAGCPEDVHGLEVVAMRADGKILRGMAHSDDLDYWKTSVPHSGMIVRYMLAVDYDAMQKASSLQRQEGGDHYKKQAIQPVEYIMANGLPYMEGNVIKYVSRWRDKGGVQDLKKAIHYLEMLIEHEEKQK